jgi:hypothetical protein
MFTRVKATCSAYHAIRYARHFFLFFYLTNLHLQLSTSVIDY